MFLLYFSKFPLFHFIKIPEIDRENHVRNFKFK